VLVDWRENREIYRLCEIRRRRERERDRLHYARQGNSVMACQLELRTVLFSFSKRKSSQLSHFAHTKVQDRERERERELEKEEKKKEDDIMEKTVINCIISLKY